MNGLHIALTGSRGQLLTLWDSLRVLSTTNRPTLSTFSLTRRLAGFLVYPSIGLLPYV